MPWWRSRWWTPAVALVLGAVIFAALAAGGDTGGGLKGFAVLAAVGAVFAIGGGRSETLGGLSGPGRDERWAMIDLRATAFAGMVVIAVLLGAWLWQLSQGEDGSPYGQVLTVGAIAYIVAIAFLRWRS